MSEVVRSHGFIALGPMHEAFAQLRGRMAGLVAFFLGALSALAFAPFNFTAILIISFTGIVWMIDGARGHRKWGKAVFYRGWAFGVGYILVGMHWTASPFLVEPEKTLIFIWMPLILLPAGVALIWGAFAAMAGAFWSSSPSRVFIFSLFFAMGEFVRGHLFGGFPWNLPGTSWIPGGAISQAASIGGVYWLTLLTVFAMAAPAALVDTRVRDGLIQRLLPTLMAVIMFAGAWAWGSQRIAEPAKMTDQYVVLMDSGVSQAKKWSLKPETIRAQYIKLMQMPDSQPGDIIVWPEGAIPVPLLQDSTSIDHVAAYMRDRTLIAGTSRYDDKHWYNSLTVLDSTASRSGPISIYDKHRLVPFGELPAAKILPFGSSISNLLPGAMQELAQSGFEPGNSPAVISSPNVPPFVALICYEALFPAVARQANLDGRAEWMVQVSNDGWFGAGMGPKQHYAQNRYRAIETGLPLVRVASRGDSVIVDGLGREVTRASRVNDALDGWATTYGRGKIPQPVAVTTYQGRIGPLLFWLTICLFVVLSFLAWRRQ